VRTARQFRFYNKQVIKGDRIYCYHKSDECGKVKFKLAFRIDIPLHRSERGYYQLYDVRVLPCFRDNILAMAVIVGKVKELSKQWRDSGKYNDIKPPLDKCYEPKQRETCHSLTPS
jgi:hypothetical protein